MKPKIYIGAFLLQMFLSLILFSTSNAQSDSAALATADTSRFSVNTSDGWLLYNSYVAEHGTDSATLELIIRHENSINWSQEHYVGKIKYEPLIPQSSQTLAYYLLNDQYALRIDQTGKCYLRLVSGYPQTANPAILPLILYYKK